MESGREKDRRDVEKVLIERDGKFELLNASDMQASGLDLAESPKTGAPLNEGTGPPNENQTEVGTSAQPNPEVAEQITQLQQQSQSADACKQEDSSGEANPSDQQKKQESDASDIQASTLELAADHQLPPATPPAPPAIDKPDTVDRSSENEAFMAVKEVPSTDSQAEPSQQPPDQPASDEHLQGGSTKLKSDSRVQIIAAEHIHGEDGPTKSSMASPKAKQAVASSEKHLASGSVLSLRRFPKSARRKEVGRTLSAPGMRFAQRKQDEEAEREKQEMNDAAFSAWLIRKNKEIAERQKLDKINQKMSEEELKQKREQNEAAFQAWMAAKDRQLQEQKASEKLSRPQTSLPKCDENLRNSEAFEYWLGKKCEQQRKETELEQRRLKEQEEAAKKADSTIVEQAYKDWLRRKKMQAKEESLKKEQYRRLYFSQSRRIKQNMTLRFEGF